jgi:hypothetical protein
VSVKLISVGVALATAVAPVMAYAQAAPSRAQAQQNNAMAQIPTCTAKLGTVSIANGDDPRGWAQNNLAPPEKLLRVIVQKSGCFNIVDRGAGLNAATQERNLNSGLGLQRGSNVGQGQVKAADYVLVAEVAAQDANTGGGAVAGALGGLVGGRFGALAAGIKTRKLEAQTTLTLTNVRTTETVAAVEGHSAKNDISFGGGGFVGFGGAIGGGYEDTDIGKIVTMAFIDAYANLVQQITGLANQGGPTAAQAAPQKTFRATRQVNMRKTPAPAGALIRALPPGATVYPTGKKQDTWWEVADENDNVGWVLNTALEPSN